MPADPLLAPCGQLIGVGFPGVEAPPDLIRRIAAGRVGWVILFARNIRDPEQLASLCASLAEAAPAQFPLAIAIDQEGGRVQRFPEPWPRWPSARRLGALPPERIEAVGAAMGAELHAAGIHLNLAPVLDVDTNPDNPVIGDRAFGTDVMTVVRAAGAYAAGLARGGALACGKHFPGHGDTHLDSHTHLPVVPHGRDRLRTVELAPFAALASVLPAIMSAHVLFPQVDPEWPATLSPTLITDTLRGSLGFEGLILSDDMEMKAVAARYSPEELATHAVEAGVDVVSACHDRARQERMLSGLLQRARRDPPFHARVLDAAERVAAFKQGLPRGPADPATCLATAQRTAHHRLAASIA